MMKLPDIAFATVRSEHPEAKVEAVGDGVYVGCVLILVVRLDRVWSGLAHAQLIRINPN
eukprot:SAG31_NODE_2600_length_5414_cov_3.077140_7_plen_59_part_00